MSEMAAQAVRDATRLVSLAYETNATDLLREIAKDKSRAFLVMSLLCGAMTGAVQTVAEASDIGVRRSARADVRSVPDTSGGVVTKESRATKRGEPPKRKTPLKRSLKPLKRVALKATSKPVPKRSRKKLKQLGEEIEFRNAVREHNHGYCEVYTRVDSVSARVICGKLRDQALIHRGAHAHHVLPRSKGGGHDPENGLWLCAHAHDWIHQQHPAEARRLGLLR